MKLRYLAGAIAATLSIGTAGLAQAATEILDLTTADPTAGFPSATEYGTIKITELTGAQAGELEFLVTPNATIGASFNVNDDKNSQHHSITFDLTGLGVKISDISAGFAQFAGPNIAQDPFGKNWEYGVDYTGGAKQGGAPSSLSFVVSDTLDNLSLASLKVGDVYGGKNIYAAVDIYDKATGNIGATIGTPEPATWAMMLMGFGGLGAALRVSRRRQAANPA
jgi:hypothetical protein